MQPISVSLNGILDNHFGLLLFFVEIIRTPTDSYCRNWASRALGFVYGFRC